MLFPEANLRIWFYTEPTDMRKSYNGLSVLVKQKMGEGPLSGHLFTFINRKQTQMKVLYFDRSGYCIRSKRLEKGQFHYRKEGGKKQLLDWARLKMILERIDTSQIRQFKRRMHRDS
jgi:transposase